jgi:hypothetical protein
MPVTPDAVHALTAGKLAELLPLCALVERLAKAVREEAKARLTADAKAVPGYALKPGAVRRSIENVGEAETLYQQAWERVKAS